MRLARPTTHALLGLACLVPSSAGAAGGPKEAMAPVGLSRPLVLETAPLEPPPTRRAALAGADLRTPSLEALALPGGASAFGLSILGGVRDARLVAEARPLTCDTGDAASVAVRRVAWAEQRDEVRRPDGETGRTEWVAEALVDGPPAGASQGSASTHLPAGAIVSVVVVIEAPERAGRCRGALEVLVEEGSGEARVVRSATVPVALDVLDIAVASEPPFLAYYRGRLVGDDAGWPETVTEETLRRDLAVLARHGVTHVTDYGVDPEAGRRFAELAAAAGLRGVVVVGWPYHLDHRSGRAEVVRAAELARERLAAARRPELEEPLLWLGDEPVGARMQAVARASAVARAVGATGTGTLQGRSYEALCGLVDVPQLDASESADVLAAATRHCRAVGARPWEYFQLWRESGRHSRWEAGFSRLAAEAEGQAAYAYAHAMGSPDADDDRPVKDLLAVHPRDDGGVDPTLQLLGLRLGRDDLRVALTARRVLARERLAGRGASALAAALADATERWSRGRNAGWSAYDPMDVAAPRRGRGPSAEHMSCERQRLLRRLAPFQASRLPTPTTPSRPEGPR